MTQDSDKDTSTPPVVICQDCQTPIEGSITRFRGEPQHEECAAKYLAPEYKSDIQESYAPQINYEQAEFSLNIIFICTVGPDNRATVAQDVLKAPGIIDVNEMLTSERNLHIKAVATNTFDLADITAQLNKHGLIIHNSKIVLNSYTQPWSPFEYGMDRK